MLYGREQTLNFLSLHCCTVLYWQMTRSFSVVFNPVHLWPQLLYVVRYTYRVCTARLSGLRLCKHLFHIEKETIFGYGMHACTVHAAMQHNVTRYVYPSGRIDGRTDGLGNQLRLAKLWHGLDIYYSIDTDTSHFRFSKMFSAFRFLFKSIQNSLVR